MDGTNDTDIQTLAVLADPVRRRLYAAVVAAPDPLGREAAAHAVGVPVHTAKFHLDKLVGAGLLDVEFRRLTGRTGPGAGRPAKLYRRSAREVSVSLPHRQYGLLSRLLAEAAARSETRQDETVAAVAGRLAFEEGRRRVGQSAARRGDDQPAARLYRALTDLGYEPRADPDGTIRLRNCVFHRATREQTELVCGLNRQFIAGVCDGLGAPDLSAELDADPSGCCVQVRTSP